MSKVSVTIEGATWGEVRDQMLQLIDAGQASESVLPRQVVPLDKADSGTPAETTPQTFAPFAAAAESWPAGQCPKHLRPWKSGQFGPYCSAKDETGPKGYCVLKPGDIWNGKNIPQVATPRDAA